MNHRVKRNIVAIVLGILFLTLLLSDVEAQSRNRLSIRQRREVAESEEKNETEHIPALANATSDRQTRQQIAHEIMSIPGITQDDSYRIQTVLNTVSVFRRLPVYQIEADKSMVMFMVNNPDSVVSIWDKLGISQISVKRRDSNLYSISDVAGTSGMMKKIWSGNNGVLYYLEGSYKGPMISKRIKGRALILARFQATTGGSGAENVVCYVDTFLSLEQEFFDAGIKLLFPMFGRVADNNLEQTLMFVRWYSDGCKSTPVSLAAFAMDLEDIPYQTRQELAKQTFLTAQRNGNIEISMNVTKLTNSMSRPVQDYQDYSERYSSTQTLAQAQPYQVNYPPVDKHSYTPMEPEPIQLDPIEEQPQLLKSEPIAVDSIVEEVLDTESVKSESVKSESVKSKSTQAIPADSVTQNVLEFEVPDVDMSTAPTLEEVAPVLEEATPTLEEAAPVLEEATPALEEAAPVLEEAEEMTTQTAEKTVGEKSNIESNILSEEVELELELDEVVPEEEIQEAPKEATPAENSDKQTKEIQSDTESEAESGPAPLPDALPVDDEPY